MFNIGRDGFCPHSFRINTKPFTFQGEPSYVIDTASFSKPENSQSVDLFKLLRIPQTLPIYNKVYMIKTTKERELFVDLCWQVMGSKLGLTTGYHC